MNSSGICFQAYIPMRKEPDSSSEMVSQVLFGETFSILEIDKQRNFSLVRMDHDSYEGWINSTCIYNLSDTEAGTISSLPIIVTHDLFNILSSTDESQSVIVGAGSILRNNRGITKTSFMDFKIPGNTKVVSTNPRELIIGYAKKFLSVPYLWGGRSGFGVDCSGLIQNLYRQIGIQIPRDASMQAVVGEAINFIGEANPGDLVFFDDLEGKIVHVGMIFAEGKVLHASGIVKIDKIDHQGIFSENQNRYTHKLRLIKKLIG